MQRSRIGDAASAQIPSPSQHLEGANHGSSDRLLTVAEVAQLLGTGVRFPRRLIAERRVRFVKLGRYVRIPASAVDELIKSSTVDVDGRPEELGV